MLSERHQQLLTAYVDGEITHPDRRRLVRLLRRSREARRLLRKLQSDSAAVMYLPPVTVPIDLSATVLETIAARQLKPSPRPVPAPPPLPPSVVRYPLWTGLVAAAAVLLVVGLGTYLYVLGPTPTAHPDNPAPFVNRPTPESEGPPVGPKEQGPPGVVQNDQKKPPVLPPGPKRPPLPPDDPFPDIPDEPDDPPPAPAPIKGPIFASGDRPNVRPFDLVRVPLPVSYRLSDLDQGTIARRVRGHLDRGSAFRIELATRDGVRAFGRLRPALAARGAELVIDQAVQGQLDRPRWLKDLALFVENVAADDVVGWLSQAVAEDRKAAAKRASDARLEGALVIAPLGRYDGRDLTDLFGIDPLKVRPAAPTGEVSLTRPLPEQTAEQVARLLEARGRTARPRVLVLSYGPTVRTRPSSPEVKRFLEGRSAARPNTVQALIVLRGV